MGHLRVDSSQLRRRPRGLSLMELLLTMFLFSAVLAMVANLARNYSEADRVLQGKTRGQLTQLMLMGLATEVGGSQVIRPQHGDGLVGEVELRRYAASGQRLASGTGRAGWTPDQVLTLR